MENNTCKTVAFGFDKHGQNIHNHSDTQTCTNWGHHTWQLFIQLTPTGIKINKWSKLDCNTWQSGTNQTASFTSYEKSQPMQLFHRSARVSDNVKNWTSTGTESTIQTGSATYSWSMSARLVPNYCLHTLFSYLCICVWKHKQMAFGFVLILRMMHCLKLQQQFGIKREECKVIPAATSV